MKYAVIFDWDGTIVSCKEKVDLVASRLCQFFPGIAEKYRLAISENQQSYGWVRKGLITSLPEDYFTCRFGIIAELIVGVQGYTNDQAWTTILHIFKEAYLQTRAKVLVNQQKLKELSNFAKLYIVSNSRIDNILTEAEILGFDRSILLFVGDAKKYCVEASETCIINISTKRPKYRELLNLIQTKYENIIVVGDNFCLDLITPISMGIRVAYVPNPLSPHIIEEYIAENRIFSGNIDDVLENLIQEMKGVVT